MSLSKVLFLVCYLQSRDNSSDQDTLVILRKGQSPFNVSSAAGRHEDCFRATFESGSGGIRNLDRIVDDHHRLHMQNYGISVSV